MTATIQAVPGLKHMARKKKQGRPLVSVLKAAALDVMATLGKGHSERVYHRAMITSLNRKRVAHRSEVIAPITYLGEVVGFGRCDLVVGNLVIEFKANARCPRKTSPQLQKYLDSLAKNERRKCRGLIINFNQKTGKIDCFQEKRRLSAS